MSGSVRTMTNADEIAKTAGQLAAILDAIEAGDLTASPTVRARLEGAVAALKSLANDET